MVCLILVASTAENECKLGSGETSVNINKCDRISTAPIDLNKKHQISCKINSDSPKALVIYELTMQDKDNNHLTELNTFIIAGIGSYATSDVLELPKETSGDVVWFLEKIKAKHTDDDATISCIVEDKK